jgi:CheY-like chemotaxis protein
MSASNKKTILIVDDDRVVLKAMSLVLTNNGYLVLTAECGADAISVLGRNKPHLVLLDLDFPPDPASVLCDGFLTLEWARRFGLAFNVPVIILSSLDPAQYQKRAEADGITNCFRKPVNERALLEAIRAELGESPAD